MRKIKKFTKKSKKSEQMLFIVRNKDSNQNQPFFISTRGSCLWSKKMPPKRKLDLGDSSFEGISKKPKLELDLPSTANEDVKNPSKSVSLASLPEEILSTIAFYCSPTTILFSLPLVNKKFLNCFSDLFFERLSRYIFFLFNDLDLVFSVALPLRVFLLLFLFSTLFFFLFLSATHFFVCFEIFF